ATILAMRASLTNQLDAQVRSSVARAAPDPDHDEAADHRPPGGGGLRLADIGNQGPGTLIALFGTTAYPPVILGEERGDVSLLDTETSARLEQVPADGRVHSVEVTDQPRYRVIAVDSPSGRLVTGLPTRNVTQAVASLVLWEALLTTAGIVIAALAGLALVRRQLRPLREVAATAHEVAELPLATGEIDLSPRVPDHLTDERTEVGQVGAALNSLLSHVESSLAARHRSEQQVRQFVADASHELRTPLATINGYAELARRRPDDESGVRTALDKVEAEAERMTHLVEDLLLLARLDAGRPLASEPVDLSRLLLEAVNDARVLAPDHHWRLDLPEEVLEVTGDEQRLHQVVTNLLTNARKYTPAGTTVAVTARAGLLTVHDDGPGFPADLVDKAFERFARGDAARSRGTEGGAGLGLSLVDAIVSAHRGRVWLRSEPGDTTVTVELPE
ncbi:MAG: HAMP domain-containing sensor histidine kinase, partial [Nocardioides sp.]